MRPLLLLLASVVACLAWSPSASAHTIGLSSGEYTRTRDQLIVKLSLARSEILPLVPLLDVNRDGHVTALEVDGAAPQLRAKVLDRVLVTAAGAPCAGRLTSAGLSDQDGLMLEGRWVCTPAAAALQVDVSFIANLASGHRHIARVVTGAEIHDQALDRDNHELTIAEASERPGASTAPRTSLDFASIFVMGVEHILTGYDHLVFLLGLLLVPARLRTLLVVVSAFTLAHSLSLALAVLGVFVPSARFIEPAIALTIAYVGIENLFVKDASRRWALALVFGLVHGFGFASALTEVDIPRARLPGALVGFNLGVEGGQLFVLTFLFPAVGALFKRPWFARRGAPALSIVIAAAGVVWFFVRLSTR